MPLRSCRVSEVLSSMILQPRNSFKSYSCYEFHRIYLSLNFYLDCDEAGFTDLEVGYFGDTLLVGSRLLHEVYFNKRNTYRLTD